MRFLAYRNRYLFDDGLCSVRLDGDGNTIREALGAKEDLSCLGNPYETVRNNLCVDLRTSLNDDIVSKSEVIGNIAFIGTENIEEAKWAEEIKAGFANVKAVIIDEEPRNIGDSVLTNLDTPDENFLFPFFSQNVNAEWAMRESMFTGSGCGTKFFFEGKYVGLVNEREIRYDKTVYWHFCDGESLKFVKRGIIKGYFGRKGILDSISNFLDSCQK